MQILRETNLDALKIAVEKGPKYILDTLEKKQLVGRGGAAFPTAKKWKFALSKKAKERFVICNADEGEPGTFKDKLILKTNPKTMLEGLLIACYTIGAERAFIYLRAEYEFIRENLQKEINEILKKANKILKKPIKIEIVRGAGAYICGEETAIMQSIMGNRGHAMYKPPYPTLEGLWGMPTILNNVETLTNVAQAIAYDDWNPNIRLFSISGDVKHPGVYEWELGVKMKTILDTVKPNKKLKAMSFGCFGGIMPVNENSTITTESVCKDNCQHGAFSIIFINEKRDIVDICLSIAKFYTYESCGKCTPCREGTIRLVNLLKKVREGNATKKDLNLLKEFAQHINETSLCGLGQSSGNHILSSLANFKQDYLKHIKHGK